MNATGKYLAIAIFVILLIECSAAAQLRAKRADNKPKIDRTVLDYMTQVASAVLANNEGIPKDLDSAPTEVWCFPDKGE